MATEIVQHSFMLFNEQMSSKTYKLPLRRKITYISMMIFQKIVDISKVVVPVFKTNLINNSEDLKGARRKPTLAQCFFKDTTY